jgi:hypothetical protein
VLAFEDTADGGAGGADPAANLGLERVPLKSFSTPRRRRAERVRLVAGSFAQKMIGCLVVDELALHP